MTTLTQEERGEKKGGGENNVSRKEKERKMYLLRPFSGGKGNVFPFRLMGLKALGGEKGKARWRLYVSNLKLHGCPKSEECRTTCSLKKSKGSSPSGGG